MSTRSRIRLSAFCVLALAGIVWTGPAAADSSEEQSPSTSLAPAQNRRAERGIVQSVSASRLVLKALDGSIVTVSIDARTRVRIDGRPASILAVRPGYVALVTFRGASGQPALEVEAFTTSPPLLAGVVRSVSAGKLVLGGSRGTRTTLAADSLARVLVDGRQAAFAAVRVGFAAVVRSAAGELQELFAFTPPRAKGARLYDGVVTFVSRTAIVLQARSVGRLRIALGTKTAVFVDGRPGSISRVASGDVVVVRTGPRRQVWAFSAR